jgi:hypothetical protein
MIPIYIINLPNEPGRLAIVQQQISGVSGVELSRVEGVSGSLIPDVACRLLTRNKWSVNHKGTLGCFLAHVRAWERIALGEAAFGLVIEDDVELSHLDELTDATLPADCDLLWCNGRTAYPSSETATFRPIFPSLAYVAQHGRAIGGDCYGLTREGAVALLSFVEADGLFTHVDLRLMAYSLTPEEGQEAHSIGKMAETVAALRATYAVDHKLTAYSLWPPITSHLLNPSRRAAEDRINERPIL